MGVALAVRLDKAQHGGQKTRRRGVLYHACPSTRAIRHIWSVVRVQPPMLAGAEWTDSTEQDRPREWMEGKRRKCDFGYPVQSLSSSLPVIRCVRDYWLSLCLLPLLHPSQLLSGTSCRWQCDRSNERWGRSQKGENDAGLCQR